MTRTSSGAGLRSRSSSAVRNAASVLPEPVGAAMSVWRPSRIAAQPCSWAGVGVPRVSENQRWMAGWKDSRDMSRRHLYNSGEFLIRQLKMQLRQSFMTALVYARATPVSAGTIVVDVRAPKTAPLADAVVYAVPEGREMPAASRT